MNKYTHSNIIIDPTKEGIEKLIGKEVYAGDIPGYCLEHANEGDSYYLCTLIEIRKYDTCPFLVKHDDQNKICSCIIEKKEEPKPEFMPFKNITEFLNAYIRVASWLGNQDLCLYNHGIWLEQKDPKGYVMATEIYDNGVVIGSNMSEIPWDELLENYTFLDGSPIGRFVKES